MPFITSKNNLTHITKNFFLKQLGQREGLPAKLVQAIKEFEEGEQLHQQDFQPEPLTESDVKQLIFERSPYLFQNIKWIDPVSYPASLGQVHRVLLNDQTEIALKIQYPGLDKKLEEQLNLFFKFLTGFEWVSKKNVDVSSYKKFFKESFLKEIDYLQELQSQDFVFNCLKDSTDFIIPKVLRSYSTSQLLAQEFVGSESLNHIVKYDDASKRKIANLLFKFIFITLFEFGFIHGDLHQKNWGFIKNQNKVVFYDFGVLVTLSSKQVQAIKNIIFDLRTHRSENIFNYLIELGYSKNLITQIPQPHLVKAVQIIFEPFCREGWLLEGWDLKKRMKEALGDNVWAFRSAGPPWFFSFFKTLTFAFHILKKLNVEIDLKKNLDDVFSLDRFLDQKVKKTSLYVRVVEGGSEKVFLQMPSHSVEVLEEIVPSEVLNKINEQKISLSEIKEKAIRTKFAPQELFCFTLSDRTISVWLE